MTIYEFMDLDEVQQTEWVIWEGAQIGEREDGEHRIVLYQIGQFYVEVFYHKECNMIQRLRPFAAISQLEPYLKMIDITALL